MHTQCDAIVTQILGKQKVKTSIFANGRQATSETASEIYQNRNAKKVFLLYIVKSLVGEPN